MKDQVPYSDKFLNTPRELYACSIAKGANTNLMTFTIKYDNQEFKALVDGDFLGSMCDKDNLCNDLEPHAQAWAEKRKAKFYPIKILINRKGTSAD